MMFSRISKFSLAALIGVTLSATTLWAEPNPAGHAPDPPPYRTAKHWVFRIDYDQAGPHLRAVRPVILDKAATTPRMMGRFAIEFFIGNELLDRIRFDVPLTAEGPTERDPKRPLRRPTFDHVKTHLDVRLGDHPRATYVQLIDRATGKKQRFWWPPTPDKPLVPFGAEATSIDAGKPDAQDAASD